LDILITIIVLGEDGPVGRPVIEQVALDDLLDRDAERFGLLLRSLAIAALMPEGETA
jgi:hypothetical protein